MNTAKIVVGTSPTQIIAANTNRTKLLLTNNGTNTVYIGDDTSTGTGSGFPIEAGELFNQNDWTGIWYGVVDSGTGNIQVYEEEATQ